MKDNVIQVTTDTFGERLKVAIPVIEEALDIMTEIKLFMWLMDHPEDHEAYQECKKVLGMVQKLPAMLQGLINIRKKKVETMAMISLPESPKVNLKHRNPDCGNPLCKRCYPESENNHE